MLLHHLAPERAHNLARPFEERAREMHQGAFAFGGGVRRVGRVGKGWVDGGLVEREGKDEVRGQVEGEDVEVREREGKDGLGCVRVGVKIEFGDLLRGIEPVNEHELCEAVSVHTIPRKAVQLRGVFTAYWRRVSGMVDCTSHAQNYTKLIQHRCAAAAVGWRRLAVQPRERSQRPESDVRDRARFVPREEGLDPFEGGCGEV